MSFFSGPSKSPTPSEIAVIAVGMSGLLIVLGLVGIGVRIFATPANHEAAAALLFYSCWSLAIGFLIGFAYWLIRRIL